jgi:hypothetical protein
LIDERLERERDSWRRLLQRTARVSPTATYLLDINQGRAHGDRRNFVISEELLNKVKFIDAGKFEEAGEPTLRVLGNVEVVRTEVVADPARLAPIDPTRQCTLYEKDVLAKLKEKIADNIPLGSGIVRPLSGVHLRSVIKAYQIPTPSQYYYRPNVPGSRVYYGEPLIDWIVTQFQADPQFFFKAYTVAIKER